MPGLQSDVLKASLIKQRLRLGHTIRATLPASSLHIIQEIKRTTGRTYRDICRLILEVYMSRSDRFDLFALIPTKGWKTFNFRVNHADSDSLKAMARKHHMKRSRMLGRIFHAFLLRVPKQELERVLVSQTDRAARFVEEVRASWMKIPQTIPQPVTLPSPSKETPPNRSTLPRRRKSRNRKSRSSRY